MKTPRFNIAAFGWKAQRDVLGAMTALPDASVLTAGMGIPLVIIQDFAAAQQVLVADADAYAKPGLIRRVIVNGLGHNLFTAQDDEWIRRRRPVAPVFAAVGMNDLAAVMSEALSEQMATWQPGEVDMQAEMTDLTMSVACRALLGIDADDDDLGRAVRTEFGTLLDWLGTHLANPALPPAWVATSGNRAMKQAKRNLQEAVRQLVADRRSGDCSGADILSRLIRSQAGPDAPSDDDIVDECIGFLFAGHETTASTLTWALYELASHPEIQERVARDGDTLRLASTTLHDDAAVLEATGEVLEETLRLYPAGVSIVRVAKRPTTIGGHKVRKRTMVMIAVYNIQRRPSVWERASSFDPDRPVPPPTLGMRDSFLAFGLGPRRCLGARFARTEMRLTLSTICSRWHLSYRSSEPPKPEVSPSLRVAGTLPINLEARPRP